MHYFLTAIILLFFHQSLFAQVSCSVSSSNKIYYNTLFVPQRTSIIFDPSIIPIGGEIYTLEGYAYYSNSTNENTTTGVFKCNKPITENHISVPLSIEAIHNGIYYYSTGIDGIAMSIMFSNRFTSTFIQEGTYSIPEGINYLPQHRFRLKLIKTGKIKKKEGSKISGVFAHEFIGGQSTPNYSSIIKIDPFYDVKIEISQNTCSYSNQTVILPTAQIKSFNKVGQTSGSHHFNLPIQCTANIEESPIDVYIKLIDAINTGNNTSILTSASSAQTGNTPAASGIGIQILKDGSPLSLNSTWKAARLPAGQPAGTLQIPLEARYIQTNATVSPGSVQARATVTLSYQ